MTVCSVEAGASSKQPYVVAVHRQSHLHAAWLCSALVPRHACDSRQRSPDVVGPLAHARVWARRLLPSAPGIVAARQRLTGLVGGVVVNHAPWLTVCYPVKVTPPPLDPSRPRTAHVFWQTSSGRHRTTSNHRQREELPTPVPLQHRELTPTRHVMTCVPSRQGASHP